MGYLPHEIEQLSKKDTYEDHVGIQKIRMTYSYVKITKHKMYLTSSSKNMH